MHGRPIDAIPAWAVPIIPVVWQPSLVTAPTGGRQAGAGGPRQFTGPAAKTFELVVGITSAAASLAALNRSQFLLAAVLLAAGILLLLAFLLWRGRPTVFVASILVAVLLAGVGVWLFAPEPARKTPAAQSTSQPASADSPGASPSAADSPFISSSPSTPVASEEVVSYLDDHAKECGIGLGSGPMSMNGTNYVHAIHQWAGSTRDSINLARQGRRFKATVGIRDDARSEVAVQFELLGDDGKRLFTSKALKYGRTQPVDVAVAGVLRITLVVNAVSKVWGYAGWADARVTSETQLPC
jgi:hypothetical protein